MTTHPLRQVPAEPFGRQPAAAARQPTRVPIAVWAVLGAALTFFMMGRYVLDVWRTGAFVDTDDTMHLLQVRALLSGQDWFNMVVPRLNPPTGTFMHWSRLVDLPVAGLVRCFAGLTDVATAERLARLVFPFALLVALYAAMARLARLAIGGEARLPVIAAAMLSGDGVCQFLPGRIDHHGPQIVLLVSMLAGAVAALDPARARQAMIVGLLSGLSLAINLENLPFIAVLGAGMVARWVWVGRPAQRAMGWYAGGLLVGCPLFFAATVAPARYLLPVCDAYGPTHLGVGLIVASGCAAAILAGARLGSRGLRAGAALVVAGAAALFVAVATPSCLHGPFAGVDPLVQALWLKNVGESLPVLRLARSDPQGAIAAVLPVALGLLGCLAAAVVGPSSRRAGFVLVSAVVATGLALSVWQVRVLTSVGAIAACGSVDAALCAGDFWRRRGRDALARASLALVFPLSATAVAIALPAGPAAAASDNTGGASFAACLAPAAFAPLATLRGTAIAPIDAGSFLLVHTSLDAFAAAFHRDDAGIRFALEVMLAPAAEAERRAVAGHAAYVITCPGLADTAIVAKRAPHGLAADLLAGRIPGWLAPVPMPRTPLRVYRVVPDPASSSPG